VNWQDNFRVARDTPAIVKKGNWVSNFSQPDLNEAARAADAAREVNGAVVASWLR
jgi:hypothetical protein